MRHPNIEKISAISRVVEGASKKCGKQDNWLILSRATREHEAGIGKKQIEKVMVIGLGYA